MKAFQPELQGMQALLTRMWSNYLNHVPITNDDIRTYNLINTTIKEALRIPEEKG